MDEDLTHRQYPEPVAQLLILGEPSGSLNDWPDYPAMGLGAEHVPDLIRMATDEALHTADWDRAESWAPVHAWRALGQLRAEAAIEPLTGLFRRVDEEENDWVGEELPRVMGLIGPAAIPALAAYLHDETRGMWARVTAGECLVNMGRSHPGAREACVAALTSQLERFAENAEDSNGFLIADLVELAAVESAPVMEQAFAVDAVDPTIAGDWEDVQIELGLLEKRITPKPRLWSFEPSRKAHGLPPGMRPPPPSGKSREKAKKKKNDQKKSRKKNRRK